jgi:hypothetical protein
MLIPHWHAGNSTLCKSGHNCNSAAAFQLTCKLFPGMLCGRTCLSIWSTLLISMIFFTFCWWRTFTIPGTKVLIFLIECREQFYCLQTFSFPISLHFGYCGLNHTHLNTRAEPPGEHDHRFAWKTASIGVLLGCCILCLRPPGSL